MPIVLPDPHVIVVPGSDPRELVLDPTPPIPPDLLDDIPPYEWPAPEIQTVLRVIANELGRFEAARQDLTANFFPGSAVALLPFFEAMLELSATEHMTITARQQQVLAFMRRLKALGTGLEWEQTMNALVGSMWTYQEHDPANPASPPPYTILLRLPYAGAVPIPTGLAANLGGVAGSLPAGTLFYVVSATSPFGETLACPPVSITVPAASEVVLTWNADTAANGFKVYRGPAINSMFMCGSTPGGTLTFTDAGTEPLGGPPPTADTSGSGEAATARKLARSITPAHLDIEAGLTAGFIIGVSEVGVDAL